MFLQQPHQQYSHTSCQHANGNAMLTYTDPLAFVPKQMEKKQKWTNWPNQGIIGGRGGSDVPESPLTGPTVVVSFLHLSVPPKMLKELVLAWHWLMSTTRRSMSRPLVPLVTGRSLRSFNVQLPQLSILSIKQSAVSCPVNYHPILYFSLLKYIPHSVFNYQPLALLVGDTDTPPFSGCQHFLLLKCRFSCFRVPFTPIPFRTVSKTLQLFLRYYLKVVKK